MTTSGVCDTDSFPDATPRNDSRAATSEASRERSASGAIATTLSWSEKSTSDSTSASSVAVSSAQARYERPTLPSSRSRAAKSSSSVRAAIVAATPSARSTSSLPWR